MTWPVMTAAEVRALAPDALESFALAMGSAEAMARRTPLVDRARLRIEALLSGVSASGSAAGDLTEDDRACLEFAEQFVLDVSQLSGADRARVGQVLGPETFAFVQSLYTFDQGWRLRHVTRQLFGADVDEPVLTDTDLWPALERMMTAVVVLDALDPLTSELVRLRGARAHHCRVCMSRRLAPVVASGDGALLERTEIGELTGAGEAAVAAVSLTDAILWRPGDVLEDVLAAVREHFTPAAALEIVLDVTRNASNKIAVALGADQASVAEGVEYFDVTVDGDYHYGLPTPS